GDLQAAGRVEPVREARVGVACRRRAREDVAAERADREAELVAGPGRRVLDRPAERAAVEEMYGADPFAGGTGGLRRADHERVAEHGQRAAEAVFAQAGRPDGGIRHHRARIDADDVVRAGRADVEAAVRRGD